MFEIVRDITGLIHLVNVLGAFDAAFPLTATHMPGSNLFIMHYPVDSRNVDRTRYYQFELHSKDQLFN